MLPYPPAHALHSAALYYAEFDWAAPNLKNAKMSDADTSVAMHAKLF